MKIVRKGWVGRTAKDISDYIRLELDVFASTDTRFRHTWCVSIPYQKGVKSDWDEEDWPLRKVKITIEVEG